MERAIEAYSDLSVAFDFEIGCELKFATIQDLERHIQTNLTARDSGLLKDALYWGYYRVGGRRDYHVRRFRSKVTAGQLEGAAALLPGLSGPGIRELRSLGLPEFRYLSFLSKFRTFLDPERYGRYPANRRRKLDPPHGGGVLMRLLLICINRLY